MAQEDKKKPDIPTPEPEDEGISEEVVCEEGAPGWVVTFGDMMSLLLTFFILLLSFASLDKVEFNKLSGTMKDGFGKITKIRIPKIERMDTVSKARPKPSRNSKVRSSGKEVRKLMEEVISATSVNDRSASAVDVFQDHNDIKVLFPLIDAFVPGTTQLQGDFKPILDLISKQVIDNTVSYDLSIEVRIKEGSPCDKEYIHTEGCDYWLLSTYQSLALSRYFKSKGVSGDRLIPVGRGTAPIQFLDKNQAKTKDGSTIEFVYLSPTSKLINRYR
jgi:chemotaxis protein MotB